MPDKPSSSARRAYSVFAYDEQGRVYRTEVYSVNQSTGALSTDTLTTDFFFDRRGYLIKTAAPGGLVDKFTYDGAGRPVMTYITDGGGDSDWDDADDVTGDHVLEQTEYQYDADSNVIFVIAKQHFHDDANTGELGDVDTTPYARVSYVAYYYDEGDRLSDVLDVGSNGGDAYTRPGSVPTRSDSERVWSYAYNDAGWLEDTTDPRGIVTHQDYNNLGWVTRTVEAYTDGTPSAADDRTTEYTYNGSGNVLTVKAVLPASAIQETAYVYQARTSTGSALNSNDLLSAVQHPDPSSGAASSSQQETYTVNALGETTGFTDRNGSIHAYTFDVVGRFTADAVTTLGSGVDGAVRRLETAYDTAGRAYLFTSYDAATSGNVVNQVQRAFNGLGQLTTEYQAHAGAVNTSTSPRVQYAYSEMASAANHSRLMSMTYPNGRELTYDYASGLDDDISRLSAIVDGDETVLEEYQYLGLSTVVVRAHPEPGVDLTYVHVDGDTQDNDDGGDPYTGFDRFGQLIDQFWIDSADDATDRFQYAYDRAGNRLSKDNLLNTDFDEDYTYDDLSRLVAMARADGFDQSWDQDAQGNFDEVDTDGTPESRTHNAQNEITVAGGVNLTYDSNGNLTTDENGNILIYDAWNRLVEVQDDQEQSLVRYERDALSRIIERTADSITTEFYYTVAWQVAEERIDDEAVIQYVWSPVYVDAMILRDRDTDDNGTLDERLYVQQDANWNVTALVNTSGAVVERTVYTPYGERTVLEADWDVQGSSGVAWRQGHQGLFFEALVGLYLNRNREYSPTLMRFVGMDPMSFAAGYTNLYAAYGNGPVSALDPLGLDGTTTRPLWRQPTEEEIANRNRQQSAMRPATPAPSPPPLLVLPKQGPAAQPPAAPMPVVPAPQAPLTLGGTAEDRVSGRPPSVDDLQEILDHAGLVDPTPISDGINSLIYLARGQIGTAAITAAGMVYVGDVIRVGRLLRRAGRTCDSVPLVSFLPSRVAPTRPAPASRVINDLRDRASRRYRIGGQELLLDRSNMRHILERHHPDYWDGTIKAQQSFLNRSMTPTHIENTITQILERNREEILRRGTNGMYQLPPTTIDGVQYVVGINNGHIGQFYPIVP